MRAARWPRWPGRTGSCGRAGPLRMVRVGPGRAAGHRGGAPPGFDLPEAAVAVTGHQLIERECGRAADQGRRAAQHGIGFFDALPRSPKVNLDALVQRSNQHDFSHPDRLRGQGRSIGGRLSADMAASSIRR